MKAKLRRNFWMAGVVSALSVQGAAMVSSGPVTDLLVFLYFICAVMGAAFAAGWCFLAVRERFGPGTPTLVASILLALVSGTASFFFLVFWAWLISPRL
jgi:hypothetical protein